MSHGITAFPLPGLDIKIGTPMDEACAKLGIEPSKYSYGNYLVAHGYAQSIFGIAVNQYHLGCYGYDGPLKEVEYGLDPSLIEEDKINFKKHLESLEKKFGIAEQKMGDDFISMTQRDSYVLAYARWKSEIFDVYFAIYSGIREMGKLKPCVGQLSFTWKDVVTAAAAHLQKQNSYVESLHLEQLDITQITLFKVDNMGYRWYETDEVRIANRALRTPWVFETPHHIKALIHETSSAIAFTPIAGGMLVSNSHDSAVLVKGDNSRVSSDNMLPAKGGGEMHLSVNGVNLHTSHSSKQIQAILDWLSTKMEIEVEVAEFYNC